MAVTLLAGWLVASERRRRRDLGFWLFLLSNLLWVVWGVASHALALIVLQFGLAFSNIRGVLGNRAESAHAGDTTAAALADDATSSPDDGVRKNRNG
jgi:hypothetical protein